MKLSEAQLRDRIRGAFWGAAIGDALGAMPEFMKKEDIKARFGIITGFESFVGIPVRRVWQVGEYTDDFSQALCVARVLLEHKKLNERALAQELVHWLESDGRGCGSLTAAVLTHKGFKTNPCKIASDVWKSGGEQSAPNGALMRMFPATLWDFWDGATVGNNTKAACAVTHADPRCERSCLTMAYLMGMLMCWPESVEGDDLINVLMAFYKNIGWEDPELLEVIIRSTRGHGIDDLKLNESIGYTYKALSAGLWALCNGKSFEDGLLPIINEGGDADTNGTVAGALLGVKFGENAIPTHLRFGLIKHKELSSFADAFIDAIADRIKSVTPQTPH